MTRIRRSSRLVAVLAAGALVLPLLTTVSAAHAHEVDTTTSSWLASDFNAAGIGDLGAANADIDGGGYYLLRSEMAAAGAPANTELTVPGSGLKFTLGGGVSGTADHVRAVGQRIETAHALGSQATGPATKIQLVGMGVNGGQQNVPLTLGLSGGPVQTTFSISDWCSSAPQYSDTLFGTHRHRYSGSTQSAAVCGLFATAPISVPAGQKLDYLRLPVNSNVRIFAIASDATTTAAVISGSRHVILTPDAVAGELMGVEVLGVTEQESVRYQWRRNGVVMRGVTGETYRPSGWDTGAAIQVQAAVIRSGFRPATAAPSAAVIVREGQIEVTADPTVSGIVRYGEELAVDPGRYRPANASVAYEWLVNGEAIPGATGATYAPDAATVGHSLSVRVTATAVGYSLHDQIVDVGKVAGRQCAVLQGARVSGASVVGETLTAIPGVYSAPQASSTTTWLRGGTPIAGATTTSYRLTTTDAGKTITARITTVAPGHDPIVELVAVGTVFSAAAAPLPASSPSVKTIKIKRKPALFHGKKTLKNRAKLKRGTVLKVRKPKVDARSVTYKYTWYRAGRKAAVGQKYRVSPKDNGKRIKVTVIMTATGYKSAKTTISKVIRVS
ncbi:hypothetical protein GCM10010401_11390 [Rarobacter faecitabidus]|uniref:Ig-like domain-containing protein n=1 Tax=Rarobacter faecitabidus TaxID=13243 RepID=A0A542ZP19_RARFA|nr:hypothetical protein [Rarobacter faecitabidus]TQL62121.1 hypothetical protein FB461_1758 [Rarobacter faecitabidus]